MFSRLFLATIFWPPSCSAWLYSLHPKLKLEAAKISQHLPQTPPIVLHCYIIFLSISRVLHQWSCPEINDNWLPSDYNTHWQQFSQWTNVLLRSFSMLIKHKQSPFYCISKYIHQTHPFIMSTYHLKIREKKKKQSQSPITSIN